MEARVAYGSHVERPRLVVIHDDGGPARYSALPHDIMRDKRLSRDARLLYAILQGYWWQRGECWASHATLAADMDCSTRMLRAYLDQLIDAGLIAERDAGVRRQKVYSPLAIGTVLPIEPVNEQPASDSGAVNRKFSTVQSEVFDSFNTSIISDSKKKTPEKKTLEEEEYRNTPVGEVAAGAAKPSATDRAGILRALSDDARAVLDWWRECHGKKRPPSLNPTQASLLEEAVADLGVDRLKESVRFMAGKGVPEIDKARTAAYTKRQIDEEAGTSSHAPAAPHVNGTASKVTPATDDDRAIWSRALVVLHDFMNDANFESSIVPLEVAGRDESGGLSLIVPPSVGRSVARFSDGIRRALLEAGDPAPLAVAFKARRSKEPSHAE